MMGIDRFVTGALRAGASQPHPRAMRTSETRRILSKFTLVAWPVLATMLTIGCATRTRPAVAPVASVSAGIVWRVEEGDIIKTRISGSPDLTADATVGASGTAFFPSLGRVSVAGLSLDSLEALLNARYSSQVIRNAAVQVTLQREVTLHGQVRTPGVYAVEPNQSVLALMARAGGVSSLSSTPGLTLETSEGRRLLMPREARLGSIDIHRRDAIYVADEGFFSRNGATITTVSVFVNMLVALTTIVLYSTR